MSTLRVLPGWSDSLRVICSFVVRDHKGNRPRDEVVHNPLKVEIAAPMPLLKVEIEESPKVLARAHSAAAV